MTSKNPMMVVTANGEVQTKEEATVFVRELDLFVTVKLLENTPAVLSLGKTLRRIWVQLPLTSGQKPHIIKNGKKIHCETSNHVRSSTLSTSLTTSQETVTDTEILATRSESTSEES